MRQAPRWQVLEERAAGGTTARYVWSPVYVDAMVLRDLATATPGTLDERVWVQQDANYNVTAVTDGSGAVLERYAYDPYGVRAVLTPSFGSRSVSSYDFKHGFQGMFFDSVSGLDSERERWYSPTMQRWTTVDPIGFGAGDNNLYRTEGDEPIGGLDPAGLLEAPKFPGPVRVPVPPIPPSVAVRGGLWGILVAEVVYAGVLAYELGDATAEFFAAEEAGRALDAQIAAASAASAATGSVAAEEAGRIAGTVAAEAIGSESVVNAGRSAGIAAAEATAAEEAAAKGRGRGPTDPPPPRLKECDACFAQGTPIRTPNGWRAIEEIQVGDVVLARDEYDPTGEATGKRIEKVFVNHGLVWHLHVSGQVLRTTAEHPFFERVKGWVACNELTIGDYIATLDGLWVRVEDMLDTGEWETLYNVRVADYHTYFVGCDEWGFSVWAHNACVSIYKAPTAGRGGKQFISGYDATDLTVAPPWGNGKLYFAKDRWIADTYAAQGPYGEGVIETQIDEKEYNAHLKIYEQVYVGSNIHKGGNLDTGVELAVPASAWAVINKGTRIWYP